MQKLSSGERWGYGIGDLGINLFFISMMTYLLSFYTDVLGISAAAAAGVISVARLVDAVTDPLMGAIAERTRSRWGRMRPYLLFGAIPLGIISVLTFTVPDLNATGKLWWAYITYVLFGILYTVVTIPYSALTASLTNDHAERTRLSTVRMACAFAGGLAISAGMPELVAKFNSPAVGYQTVMIGFAVLATIFLWLTFANTVERIHPEHTQSMSLVESFRAVSTNVPLWIVIMMFTCGMLSFTIRQTVTVYYFKYNLERPDLIGTWFLITMPIMFVGLLFTPKLAELLGKAGAIIVGALVTIGASIGMYFTPSESITQLFFWGCVMALGGTPIAVLGWSMLPDTVEYAEHKTGVRADGAIFSCASFFQKLGKTIGGAGVAAALAMGGYVANEVQTTQSLNAIKNMMTLAPAVIMLVLIGFACLYRLDADTHGRLIKEIDARRQTS